MTALADSPPPTEKASGPDARLRMGLETTLLAWVRTGMALMGFGFVVARFGLFLRELIAARHLPERRGLSVSLYLGVALILLGVGVNLASGWLTWRFLRKHPPAGEDLPATMPLGLVLSFLVALVGMAMAVYLAALEV
jgi:putative membrane protein